ncbi:pentapeptide repeat-containing protein [Actinokineospora diospyrosa]|uniref:pentapeptide repeat-containing protein n=1 Tax=Actinokineospora diospyrosa TaxID=103728 RepID=UPI0020A4E3D3|nr:pentapeptide repeat-containing protein [Actinokineospora diospyrosa]
MAIVLLTAAAIGALLWLGRGGNSTALEAVKIGLTVGLGGGGAFALFLAWRRQQSTDIALQQKRDDQAHQDRVHAHERQVAVDAREDAKARRITELYTKASDQLGSDKAAVRLAGLYALERLAQDNADDPHLRQTVVNVWCAYLRMPYTPPGKLDEVERREALQEREVRLAAQRVLATHLRPGSDLDAPLPTYWPAIVIDLAGATLINFDFADCHVATATFITATFTGSTTFRNARTTGTVSFDGAEFGGDVWFRGMRFGGDAMFIRAVFDGAVSFGRAVFDGYAGFGGAWFNGEAGFGGVRFGGDAWFREARFITNAAFGRAMVRIVPKGALGGAKSRLDHWPSGWIVEDVARSVDDQEGEWMRIVPVVLPMDP